LDLSEVTWNDDFRVSETEGEALPGNPRQTSQPAFFEINHLMCSLINYDLPSHYYIKRHLLDYVFW
jgi:hypothetical protein